MIELIQFNKVQNITKLRIQWNIYNITIPRYVLFHVTRIYPTQMMWYRVGELTKLYVITFKRSNKVVLNHELNVYIILMAKTCII